MPVRATMRMSSYGAWWSLAAAYSSCSAEHGERTHLADNLAHVPHGVNHVAGSRLAFGADHGGAFGDAAQGLAQVARSADKGVVKACLSM